MTKMRYTEYKMGKILEYCKSLPIKVDIEVIAPIVYAYVMTN